MPKFVKCVHLVGLPPLEISAEMEFDEPGETYFCHQGVYPIAFEIWEKQPDGISPNSDNSPNWMWVLHYRGINFKNRKAKEPFPGGAILSSEDGDFLEIDGANTFDINHPGLLDELRSIAAMFPASEPARPAVVLNRIKDRLFAVLTEHSAFENLDPLISALIRLQRGVPVLDCDPEILAAQFRQLIIDTYGLFAFQAFEQSLGNQDNAFYRQLSLALMDKTDR